MTTTTPVRIVAQPLSNSSCKFTVEQPVYPDGSYYFGRADQAATSPLARRLFAIQGVTSLLISHDEVTINKGGYDEWPVIGRQIGAAIREHLASGEPAVDPSLIAALPSADEIRLRVQQVIEAEINPAIASHGGFVQLIDVQANNLFIRMGGGCQGCGQAKVTLKHGVEASIRQNVPEVGGIFDTTDHAAGRNPYYAAH